ncbi:PIN domain-containing protein [Mucilaginibacter sp. FT3.2]|uniref:PIN domain-containing protein n=1 Tax=Mucilaginibacter sp. FT3.2 TaxID=2723090 RepID=UPI00160C6E6D|nr:PIN domain-containing protein [Mucilaginibacter sp. FT3.2]MBB6234985.1 putative nucleic acid-binding protein [Mucilaginibacter sp. FT3.2]
MIVVADTNILFSACLTPDNRIFEILFSTSPKLQLISSYYAIEELRQHKAKLIRLSKHSEQEIEILLMAVLKQIDFFGEDIIEKKYWIEADNLTKGVDSKDISFVALALKTNAMLWTGDKKLVNHLKTLNFENIINTSELYALLSIDN